MDSRIELFPNAAIIEHPLVQMNLTKLRESSTGPGEFRRILSETAKMLAYEALRDLGTSTRQIDTPMGPTLGSFVDVDIVIVSILRAGNGMLAGTMELCDSARIGFVGIYRDHDTLDAVEYYCKLPGSIENSLVLIVDPMLATANTAKAAFDKITSSGADAIRLITLVASPEGLSTLAEHAPSLRVITASIDDGLDANGYILPGLGDAGDRLFGI